MSEVDEIVDEFSGMITRKHAEGIKKGGTATKDVTNATSVLEFINMKKRAKPQERLMRGPYSVNVRDYVYRIFNPVTYTVNNRQRTRRTMVLGVEGSTINLVLRDRISDLVDFAAIERGDMIIVNNAMVDLAREELAADRSTVISRVAPAPQRLAITDFSILKEGLKNVDLVGKVVEIGAIRYVNRLGRNDQIGISDCIATDLSVSVPISLWGSSAIATAKMSVGDFIKIEFCSVRSRNERLEVYANDFSRVFSNRALGNRLRARW